eukprot:COSAG01_NODE_9277_length_2496_cov_1.655820_4_plen_364_part_00
MGNSVAIASMYSKCLQPASTSELSEEVTELWPAVTASERFAAVAATQPGGISYLTMKRKEFGACDTSHALIRSVYDGTFPLDSVEPALAESLHDVHLSAMSPDTQLGRMCKSGIGGREIDSAVSTQSPFFVRLMAHERQQLYKCLPDNSAETEAQFMNVCIVFHGVNCVNKRHDVVKTLSEITVSDPLQYRKMRGLPTDADTIIASKERRKLDTRFVDMELPDAPLVPLPPMCGPRSVTSLEDMQQRHPQLYKRLPSRDKLPECDLHALFSRLSERTLLIDDQRRTNLYKRGAANTLKRILTTEKREKGSKVLHPLMLLPVPSKIGTSPMDHDAGGPPPAPSPGPDQTRSKVHEKQCKGHARI